MSDLHRPVIAASYGKPAEEAHAAVLMIHGRGDSAQGILQLAAALKRPEMAFVAPQASNNTWYPHTFLAPVEQNEPWLSSALQAIAGVLELLEGSGVPRERTVLLGFSQGACLASEFAARTGGRFGAVAALSGGLIGDEVTNKAYSANLAGTPVFLGCSDVDMHIPVERVHESAQRLEESGAQVEKRIYPGMGHTVNQDEIEYLQQLLDGLN